MTIDEVIAALYDSLCFDAGGGPDWQRLDGVLAPGARLVRISDDGVFAFDPQSFRRDLEEKIASGALPSFHERELSRDMKTFGDLAHVLSIYEGRTSRDAAPLFRAVKSMQLFRRDGRWWISALLWQREGDQRRVVSSTIA